MSDTRLRDHLRTQLAGLKETGLYKKERLIQSPQGPAIRVGGRDVDRAGRHAVDLDDRHSLAREVDAEVGRAGEVVRDAREEHGAGQFASRHTTVVSDGT